MRKEEAKALLEEIDLLSAKGVDRPKVNSLKRKLEVLSGATIPEIRRSKAAKKHDSFLEFRVGHDKVMIARQDNDGIYLYVKDRKDDIITQDVASFNCHGRAVRAQVFKSNNHCANLTIKVKEG